MQATRTGPSAKAANNRILTSIPESEYAKLRPFLTLEYLSHHKTLHDPYKEMQNVYFLNDGLVSLLIETQDGKTVEVGAVGNNGMVGLPATFGLGRNPLRVIVQIAGDAFRMRAAALQRALPSMPVLGLLLNRYSALQSLQISQMAACNRLHNVEQRLARWLLSVQAHSPSHSIVVTHDFLAAMLGTDRPSVSLAAGNFQRRQIIEYKRGTLKVLSRRKLERSSCECYEVIEQLAAETTEP